MRFPRSRPAVTGLTVVARLALAAGCLLLAACGASSSSGPAVAELPSGSGPASGSSASGGVLGTVSATAAAASSLARPRLRLDMTSEEEDAVYARHEVCLDQHGAGKKAFSSSRRPTPEQERAGREACRAHDPLPPWEYDRANPESQAFVHRVVLCLRAKGVRYVEESSGEGDQRGVSLGGKDNDPSSIRIGLEQIPGCERQAAGSKR
jgi:hypothetical protein